MTYHIPLLFNIIFYLSGRVNISTHADKIVFSRIFFSSRLVDQMGRGLRRHSIK